MADTEKSSHLTDHAFASREEPVPVIPPFGVRVMLPANLHLCCTCRMAEAAHRETTVKR